MPYPKEEITSKDIGIIITISIIILIFVLALILLGFVISKDNNITLPKNAIAESTQWGGYSPYQIYTVFDKNTGVYYAITETGDICPMYTIEGEVKLVDQGNEYVVHKNLGEPNATVE